MTVRNMTIALPFALSLYSALRSRTYRGGPLAVLLTVLAASVAVAPAKAQNLPDILNGERFMKKTDDFSFLTVYQPNANSPSFNYDIVTFNTANSQFPGGGTPSSQQTIAQSQGAPNQLPSAPAVAVASGRMFNTRNDQFMSLSIADDGNAPFWSFYYYNPASFTNQQPIYNSRVPASGGNNFAWLVMGNFSGTGLLGAVGVYANLSSNTVQWGIDILGPATNQGTPPPTNALGEGPELYTSSPASQNQNFVSLNQNSVAIGDFNNDGRDEIAVLMNDNQTVRFYSVDPNNYTISPMSPASIYLPKPVYRGTLVPGRFVSANQVDLVAVGEDALPDYKVTFEYISTQSNGAFAPQLMQPAVAPTAITNDGAPSTLFGYAAAIVNPASPHLPSGGNAVFGPQQLVLMSQNLNGRQNFWIGDFSVDPSPDSNFKYGFLQLEYSAFRGTCALGMQLGNFDNQTSDGSYNPADQVAVLLNNSGCTSGTPYMTLLRIQVPSTLSYQFAQNDWLTTIAQPRPSPTGNQASAGYPSVIALQVSDVQGRSQQLGAPTVVTIASQTQPRVVLGVPPMHVDYVVPTTQKICETGTLNSVTGQCVANISYQPTQPPSTNLGSFNTLLNLTTITNKTTKSTSTSSWGLSVKVSAGVKISFNDLEENASVNIKDTAAALYNSTVANTNSKYSSHTLSLTTATTTQDLLFFEERSLALYYYPILGLNDNDGNPEYIEFSVPSDVSNNQDVEGALQDWFQPVHEPGNVLSYPWSFAQIQDNFANPVASVTPSAPTCQEMGTGSSSFQNSWTTANGQSQSVGSVSTFSNDLSVSGSEGLGVAGIDGADVSFGIDVGSSSSLGSLNLEVNRVQKGTGVTTNLPSFFHWNSDRYYLSSFIFGESAPSSVNVLQSLTPSGDQISNGPLFIDYIADPAPNLPGGTCSDTAAQAGWQQMYSLPDVGFNHPQRWTWTPTGANLGVSFEDPDPSDPIRSHFYHMKGLFVTSQASAGKEPAGASGPYSNQANIGDTLQITARVYNFSMRDTDDPGLQHPAASVHVAFYGQSYCPGTGLVCGSAFQIGEALSNDPIPGFKSVRHSGPNWTLISTSFDTSQFNLQPGPLVFWAVTWMEDANGLLVPEVADHGLTSIPPVHMTAIGNIKIEPYSNNVGMFGVHTQFSLLPAIGAGASGLLNASLETPAKRTSGNLGGIQVKVNSPNVNLDDFLYLSTRFSAGGGAADATTVRYFDGDPKAGGKLLDRQFIHHIDAGSSYVHRTSFQLNSCGTHDIYAQALLEGGKLSQVSEPLPVKVSVQPVPWVGGMRTYLDRIELPYSISHSLGLNLKLAQQLFQEHEPARGRAALDLFSTITDSISTRTKGQEAREQLRRLASQARTINSCLK